MPDAKKQCWLSLPTRAFGVGLFIMQIGLHSRRRVHVYL
jgi:hypothetical protein